MIATERLYYHDSYLRAFEAQVSAMEGTRVYLDRTAFYPSSGGQPFDLGTLGGARVEEVVDEGERIAHILSQPVEAGLVQCEIDWGRRFDHMQQHSGQHLLSATLVELFNFTTVSFHLGEETSTIDIATPSLDPAQVERAQERANAIVFENRTVGITFASGSEDLGLRKPSGREGELRIISIQDYDRSACGGTHVRSTAEIGPILIRKLDKIRGNVRIEFVCGARAVRRARADYVALSRIARSLAAALDAAPELIETQSERLRELEKSRLKLAVELAQSKGVELYNSTTPSESGVRRAVVSEPITDELRAKAQGFTGQSRSVFIALCPDPPSLLVAASKDSGVNAGEIVKSAVTANGGRGGGSPVMAQGSVPSLDALEKVKAQILG